MYENVTSSIKLGDAGLHQLCRILLQFHQLSTRFYRIKKKKVCLCAVEQKNKMVEGGGVYVCLAGKVEKVE